MRPGASIERAHSATFTASPSFAGANELTSAPTPMLAAARHEPMRPPAAPSAERQAPTVQTKLSTNPAPPTTSQCHSAPARAANAEETRPPSRPGVAATATSARSATAERASLEREMVISGPSELGTQYLASG